MTGCLINGRTRYPDRIVEQAKAMFAAGIKPGKIAAALGISSDVVVRRWCDEEYRREYNIRARDKARAARGEPVDDLSDMLPRRGARPWPSSCPRTVK